MSEDSLKQYLYDHIPLTKAMEVEVVGASDESLTLSAPIGPNINHRETVFGGSASALCILSAWSFIHCRLRNHAEIRPRIVIQRNSMEYLKPVLGEFQARCALKEEKDWEWLIKCLKRKGVGRITLGSELLCEGEVVGEFEGSFVVSDLGE
ncbi:MAG: YiiD C-terminal domain-containing protein [Verrucomicrobiaceae bacterium]